MEYIFLYEHIYYFCGGRPRNTLFSFNFLTQFCIVMSTSETHLTSFSIGTLIVLYLYVLNTQYRQSGTVLFSFHCTKYNNSYYLPCIYIPIKKIYTFKCLNFLSIVVFLQQVLFVYVNFIL